MGNTYNHEHYVAFRDSQHNPIRRGDKTGDAKLEPMVQWGGWIPAEKVNRIAAISANYVSKMDGYYQELYSRLPKSVLMWTVEEVACWLGVIGMGSQQGKFSTFVGDFRAIGHRWQFCLPALDGGPMGGNWDQECYELGDFLGLDPSGLHGVREVCQ